MYYRIVIFARENSDIPQFTDTLSVASDYKDASFTCLGNYFTIKQDINDIPHIVWSDGRNNKMAIYYA